MVLMQSELDNDKVVLHFYLSCTSQHENIASHLCIEPPHYPLLFIAAAAANKLQFDKIIKQTKLYDLRSSNFICV